MRRLTVAVAVIALASLAGCSAISGGTADGPLVEAADPSANATDVTHTVRIEVGEASAGEE